ncbi:MAG TPA: FAD-dependent oxidoreductase [Candidatus Acidoferrum sp.]|nr:FAD-dependent oxidoreductase [Candidatus Acidoferrum sp.]
MPTPSLVVFSHLRWDFVFQRPQHLMTRLAQHYRVYFFEEPVFTDGASFLETINPQSNIQVLRPHTSVRSSGFHDEQLSELKTLIQELNAGVDLQDCIAWFYTPMALPLLAHLSPSAVVYDCMDELTAFKNAPRQLVQRENALLKASNLVFTGGPSLFKAKQPRHPQVYCFPSSVDAKHFARARYGEQHALLRELPRPRLGYFGVIDERLDLELIAALADTHPEWHISMVGPVVKIDGDTLPRRPNIQYFGQQAYDVLPQFLAGWDLCLLPFALNDATRFISPTKTLEYMAADLPIVSTPVADVADLYSDLVYLGSGAADFVAACESALGASAGERDARAEGMRRVVQSTSWDKTVEEMRQLIEAARTDGLAPAAREIIARESEQLAGRENTVLGDTTQVDCLVLGAGPTGLSAAYHLDKGAVVLEKNGSVGGWCRSVSDEGFTFDHAGHIMFSNDPYVHHMYEKLLGENIHWQNREAWIYSKGTYTRYPFQGALYGLPPQVLKECIVGAIEARFGELGGAPRSAEACQPRDTKSQKVEDCCADGTAQKLTTLSNAPVLQPPSTAPANFEEFIYKVWGAGVAKHFAIPYNKKLWTVPLAEMETSWLGGRVPLPNLEEMITGALEPVAKPVGPNARFGYPLKGGFQALMDGFKLLIRGEIKLNAQAVSVSPARRVVTLRDGKTYQYRDLISTLPLPELIRMIGDEAPEDVRRAAAALRRVSVRCVNLGIGRENLTDKHWIYYPEDTIFHRIFVQGNASPYCNPPGGFGITCEISYSPHKPLPVDGQALIDRCIADCIEVGMIRNTDIILTANQVDMPYAYVVYDHARAENVQRIRTWLENSGITIAGRYAEWEYYNSDHAFIAGKRAAEKVMRSQASQSAQSGVKTA